MANKKAAIKDLRQAKKRAVINEKVKRNIKLLTKKSLKALDGKNKEDAKKNALAAIKAIDKAVQKKVLKKNTGARKKSALMRRVNANA